MKSIYYPVAALLGGAIGLALHLWQRSTSFDAEGLPLYGVPTSTLTAGVIVLAILLAVLALRNKRSAQPLDRLLSAAPPKALLALQLTSVPYLVSAWLLIQHVQQQGYTSSSVLEAANVVLPSLLVFFSLLCVASLLALPAWTGKGPGALCPIVPCLTSCIWLIHSYHSHANDPVLLHYVWLVLASMASMLAWRYTCSLAYSRPRTRWALMWSMVTVLLSLTALADTTALYHLPLLLAQVWWFSWQSWLIASSCPAQAEAPAQSSTPAPKQS